MIFRLRRLMICAAALLALPSLAHAGGAPVVDAPAGVVEGTAEGTLRVFKGIPFAQPPVGKARWTPPVPMARWAGVRPATEFGPACIQPDVKLASIYTAPPLPMSEDCLTLNVWAPADARNAPVFVWIYGGRAVVGRQQGDAL